ncbi:multidrug resistance protein [Capsaspora owczarzaki ATCC 30864]|uniref:Multidrug resistance protein n=1 Tax=Capsaspora owczarzaki (strain ATCC 30864) TaxID=595528 RepID=A0A0D2VU02_CAPO3|nr:multidrug resistance protein [Capsaspora owczarzaki ATCC 30864]KJE94832.1 multidrug resistance protein [Capsaspora owczarzaki ATCC 30864]|eukprot:XP_004346077.1 multidrug resistance protein [Capsaspora owczarzaki ATCC 30864]
MMASPRTTLMMLVAAVTAAMLTTTAMGDPVCPPLDPNLFYSWSGYVTSPPTGTVCRPAVLPTNEVCRMCQQVQVPVAFCPPGYTPARDERYPSCLLCPAGYYCKATGDTYPVVCPSGHYCPAGSTYARACYSTSVCPEGSEKQAFLGGFLGMALVLIVLAVIMHWLNARQRKRAVKSLPVTSTATMLPRLGSTTAQTNPALALVQSRAPPSAPNSNSTVRETDDLALAAVTDELAKGAIGMTVFNAKADDAERQSIDADAADAGRDSYSVAVRPSRTRTITATTTGSEQQQQQQQQRQPAFASAAKIDIRFDKLGLTIRRKSGIIRRKVTEQVILREVSGEFLHGRLTAIMGPSGAGKTSLLNVLCGKAKRTSGHLYINGQKGEIEQYKKVMGFVPQDDIMLRELTVEELLTHSARVRLPAELSRAEIARRVDGVIATLGLTEVRQSRIGDELRRGVSGGQRKRVNIGMELVAETACIFLDEPTSGLDSSSAEEVTSALQTIAASGINVIAVIHQPRVEIFNMFHSIMLLAKGGMVAYHGPTAGALGYFHEIGFAAVGNTSAPDYLMDVLSGHVSRRAVGGATTTADDQQLSVAPEDLHKEWQKREPEVTAPVLSERSSSFSRVRSLSKLLKWNEPIHRTTAAFPTQLVLFAYRSILQTRHAVGRFLLDNFLFAFTGVYIGLSFLDPKYVLPIPTAVSNYCPNTLSQLVNGLVSATPQGGENFRNWCSNCSPSEENIGLMGIYMCMGIGVMATAVSVRTFGDERIVYWRDASSGINTLAYFIGKCVVDFAKFLFFTWSFLATFMLVAAPFGSFNGYFQVVLAVIWCMSSLGYITSIVLSRQNSGFTAVMLGIIWSLTTGFVFSTEKLGFFGIISFPRWFGEAVFAVETADISSGPHSVINTVVLAGGQAFPVQQAYGSGLEQFADLRYGYTLGRLSTNVLMMFVLGAALRVIAYALLRLTNRRKQR